MRISIRVNGSDPDEHLVDADLEPLCQTLKRIDSGPLLLMEDPRDVPLVGSAALGYRVQRAEAEDRKTHV